jgi:prolyl-tRNA synthetase
MRQSQLFTKTRKEIPADETSKNAQLLLRAGFIHKEMAGAYAFLPLGQKVLNNIINVIREEMNAIDGQEISMTALQDKSIWEKTDRWDDKNVDIWFKTKLKNDQAVGLGFTHEEPITNMMTQFVRSYRDLPKFVYQFQTKFRNETRAKSGIMRTREFIMKDLYSFCHSQVEQDVYYDKVKNTYIKIFKRLGLGDKTYLTFASGGTFSKYSHEFQTICDAGEDEIYIHHDKHIAINKEVMNPEVLKDLGIEEKDLRIEKASEVGNIFSLGTRFSDAMGLNFNDEDGKKKEVWMGSYGIGPARVMGVIVETLSDEKGMVWPHEVAPFALHLVSLGKEGSEAQKKADELYEELRKHKVDVLFDDREVGAGEKFADSDLIGIPIRAVVSEKSLQAGGVEIKERKGDKSEIISVEQFIKMYTNCCDDCNH